MREKRVLDGAKEGYEFWLKCASVIDETDDNIPEAMIKLKAIVEAISIQELKETVIKVNALHESVGIIIHFLVLHIAGRTFTQELDKNASNG